MPRSRLLLAAGLVTSGLALTACSASQQSAVAATSVQSEMTRLVALVNEVRGRSRTCGTQTYAAAGPLAVDGRLTVAAQAHSDDMAARDYFAHASPEGDTSAQRVSARGYNWSYVGENLAAGQVTATQVVNDWLASPGHCENLMRGQYTHFGVGYAPGGSGNQYGTYWTMVYARPASK